MQPVVVRYKIRNLIFFNRNGLRPGLKRWGALFLIVTIILLNGPSAPPTLAAPPAQAPDDLQELMAKADREGLISVMIGLDVTVKPEGMVTDQQVKQQRQAVQDVQDKVLDKMSQTEMTVLAQYKYIPYMAVSVDAQALAKLAELPEVVSLGENEMLYPTLASSIPVIGADIAWLAGYTGAGQTVAVLDTGVDKTHPFFTTGSPKVVSEACYSTTIPGLSLSVCPGGVTMSTAPGSGVDCRTVLPLIDGCDHGTHVAGIAAGNNGGANIGVARDADLIAIQVFSYLPNAGDVGAFSSDIIKGLERVFELRDSYNIAAVNMSLGGGRFSGVCDTANITTASIKAAADLLVSVGIAPIAASGNEGYPDSMSQPACVSSIISVGATDDFDNVAGFTNVAPFLDLLAPGVSIESSVPGGGTAFEHGTSMATPMVAGAWAVMKQKFGDEKSVSETLALFKNTGTVVNSPSVSGLRRINLDKALGVPPLLVKKQAPLLVDAGQALTYTISITNADRMTSASNIFITDTVPAGTILNVASLGGAGHSGTAPGSIITWATGATLLPGMGLHQTFAVTVGAGLADFTRIVNTAYVSPTEISMRQSVSVTTTVGGGFAFLPVVLK